MTSGLGNSQLDLVTGAFSYSGQAIAEQLLARGHGVRTLTAHAPGADASGIEVADYRFDDPVELAQSFEGVHTFYNTYWVRFAHGRSSHEVAVANSMMLFEAAARAGVQRIVHVSITHPSIESPLPYFSGKAKVERALAGSGVPFSIVRPAILFGGNDVLLNNIAWLLRNLPVFAIGGSGDYRIRGIHVDDLARLVIAQDDESRSDSVIDGVGPDRPTFTELVLAVRAATKSKCRVIHVPLQAIPPASRVLGRFLRDVLLTRDELMAMAQGLADTDGPSTGSISVLQWLDHHGDQLGLDYANELERHFAAPSGLVSTTV
jgi:uncharacterized protein YbjT (DUF2867 family)